LADLSAPFGRATTALALLAIDPKGLGGLAVRARSGPVRDAFVGMLSCLPLPTTRLHPSMTDAALYGGLDLAATLASGHLMQEQGLLRQPSALVLVMAERCTAEMSGRLAATLDEGRGHCLVALDEGAAADEVVASALLERMAFQLDLSEVALGDVTGFPPDPDELALAREVLKSVTTEPAVTKQIIGLCDQLGIDSLRAPLFALRAARAHAAWSGRTGIAAEDLEVACALTLAHRATTIPESPPPPEPPQDDPSPSAEDSPAPEDEWVIPDDMLLDAVRAMVPDDLLARLAGTRARLAKGSGSGATKRGNRRGRPLPPRAGAVRDGARIDLVATLRSAAPWQTIRAAARPAHTGLHIRSSDIRLKRFEDKSDRLLIFAVDASGSAALARLAEAKGAVELLLAQAYARRDHVALIAFRGAGADVLLPPTRSLVQTKRRLAGLPGGGGTPLAAGLKAALEMSGHARRKGLTPTLALLTDGRANIALDGSANRRLAADDAEKMARILRASGTQSIVIDTGNRPEPALRALSATLSGHYLALPRADAKRLSVAVTAALGD
jgi:magnesium chelatase subunit D